MALLSENSKIEDNGSKSVSLNVEQTLYASEFSVKILVQRSNSGHVIGNASYEVEVAQALEAGSVIAHAPVKLGVWLVMSGNTVVIKVSAGFLRGSILKTLYGKTYFSFQGIPYAEPPIGELRFKAPKPIEPWSSIRDALREPNVAPQYDMFTKKYIDSSNEDCLYLNVYTTKIPDEKSNGLSRPVMFFIHGGGFQIGSGNTDLYGPDYLVTHDVVLVTCNYRLGPLGFLSLETKDYPGNNGLKDVVLALKWVQQNIEKFGGNPGNVTIFGESAGGAAVEFLSLSKNTKNLFHKAILQSGSALNPWALTKRAREYAFFLGELLGCKTDDDETLIDFLRKVNPRELITKAKEVVKVLRPGKKYEDSGFVVTVEPESNESIISKNPLDALSSGDFHDIPIISGYTDSEGIMYMEDGVPTVKKNEDLETYLTFDSPTKIPAETLKKLRDFYFSDGVSEKNVIRIFSSFYITNGVNQIVETLRRNPSRQSSTYCYVFSFDGENGWYKRMMNLEKYPGACHCDELGYLFRANAQEHTAREGSREYNTIQTMTTLWSNFAKNGNPNFSSTSWKAVTAKEKHYLDIGDVLSSKKDHAKEDFDFWDGIYREILNCNSN